MPRSFGFEYIFGKPEGRRPHAGGICAALSELACETVIDACKIAKKYVVNDAFVIVLYHTRRAKRIACVLFYQMYFPRPYYQS